MKKEKRILSRKKIKRFFLFQTSFRELSVTSMRITRNFGLSVASERHRITMPLLAVYGKPMRFNGKRTPFR